MRTAIEHAADMADVGTLRLLGTEPDFDRHLRGAQALVALPGNIGIDVLQRRDHPCDAGTDYGIGAGRRSTFMRARLERNIERGAARRPARALERLGLRMRPAARLGPSAA